MDAPIVEVQLPQVVKTGAISDLARLRIERDVKAGNYLNGDAVSLFPRQSRECGCVAQEVSVRL
jgi:hypothetical protein